MPLPSPYSYHLYTYTTEAAFPGTRKTRTNHSKALIRSLWISNFYSLGIFLPKRRLFSIFSLKVLHDSIVGLIRIYTYRWSCVHEESATVLLYTYTELNQWGRPLVLAFSIRWMEQHSACNLHSVDDICSHIQLTVGVWDKILLMLNP